MKGVSVALLGLVLVQAGCARETSSASKRAPNSPVEPSGTGGPPGGAPSSSGAPSSPGAPSSSGTSLPTAPSSSTPSLRAPSAASAEPARSRVARLRRSGPLGIPVHAAPRERTEFFRVPDGTLVEGTPLPEADSWYRVALEDGRVGYVVRRYLAFEESAEGAAGALSGETRADCERALARTKRRGGTRIGTFNVRWFPDGGRGGKSDGGPTDVDWLACAILRTEASVFALEEWSSSSRAEAATKRLLGRLAESTGSPWRLELDECHQGGAQRVGLLWNTGEATLSGLRTLPEYNPHGRACEQKNRPGLSAEVRLGERRFEMVAVHFKSGTDARSFGMRDRSFLALAEHAKTARIPLVVAGDFNTMGCEDCVPPVSAEEERRRRDGALRTAGGDLVPDAPSCSHYYGETPGLLDGFATFGLSSQAVTVGGECARSDCRVARGGEFFRTVSDHCPLALELAGP